MAPLTLKKANGTLIPLVNASPLRGIASGEQKISLLTDDTLSISVDSVGVLDIGIGDTLPVYNQLYTLNAQPTITKQGENRYRYELLLEGPQYHLLRVAFFDTDVNGNALSSTFSLTGNLQFFAEVLFNNMVRVFSGAWGLGTVSVPGESTSSGGAGTTIPGNQTETKALSFENENCLGVLQRLCAEWGTEFSIEYRPNDAPNRILSIGPAGTVKTDTFSYGQGNGLYELSRKPVAQTPFYTRVYVFGGSKNLPAGYRNFATRLQLPNASPSPTASPWDSYVQDSAAIAAYGLIEGTQVFEDIYPSFTGTVASVPFRLNLVGAAPLGFNPYAVDHVENINGNPTPVYKYLTPGVRPKVSFLTGQLAGYTFNIIEYYALSGMLRIEEYTDENGLVFPGVDDSSPFRIGVGDTYTLVDLKMPDSYVTGAEEKLLAAGQAYLAENSAPSVEYSLELDELYLQKKANDTGAAPMDNPPSFFVVGDTIRLVDTALGIDKLARVTGFTRDVLRPYKYSLTLGDTRRISRLQRVLAQQISIRDTVSTVGDQPAAGTSPDPTKTTLGEIKKAIAIQGTAIGHTLSAGPLPAGFMADAAMNNARHQLLVNVVKTSGGVRQRIGIVSAIGRKLPIG